MKVLEVWTKVKYMEVGFIGGAVVFTFRTEMCAKHCLKWHKANPAYIVNKFGAAWYC